MPKPKVRPPRTPRREPPKVTIANLNLQVKLLTQRCVDLVTSRDQEIRHSIGYREQRDEAILRVKVLETRIDDIQSSLGHLGKEHYHLRGYQERVREEDKHRYGDLPGDSA